MFLRERNSANILFAWSNVGNDHRISEEATVIGIAWLVDSKNSPIQKWLEARLVTLLQLSALPACTCSLLREMANFHVLAG